jgi:hypothetical protein
VLPANATLTARTDRSSKPELQRLMFLIAQRSLRTVLMDDQTSAEPDE